MKTLQIVAPAYNEEEVIERFCREVLAVLDGLAERYSCELIVVVDGADDRTFDIVGGLAEDESRLKSVLLSKRCGHQVALKAGIDHADADVVVMMDSDLQHPPELIPQLVAEYEKGSSIVFTQRRGHQGLIKELLSRSFYGLVNCLSRTKLLTASSDFRLIDRKVLTVAKELGEHDPFFRGLFRWVGFRTAIVSYELRERAGGRPKYSIGTSFRLAIAGVTSFSTLPLSLGVYIGIFSVVLCTLLGSAFAAHAFYVKTVNWDVLHALLILFVGGIQIFLIGIIGEYVGRMFLEQKKRPLYLVDRKLGFAKDSDGSE